ncbi:astacin-like metalloprotease toxin 5 [Manduca sexta]|uniref:Metalloendopeptidase n=1 Tax=Manduca sexta TaxID=7130 RepID=A0A921ZW52_MANSE|nr:astacin-like metalloprotease toxin 5 [Manduca sexta]XP_037301455.1 astacin-like metalloprotease toxin 5 [Manduca sexta]KAG6464027.1 hypothetical protein O3G_MSEX014227 [Manduca sexta]
MYVLIILFGVALARTPAVRQEAEIYKDFLDNTRTEHGITLEQRMAASPKAKIWENSGRYEGDILLDDVLADGLLQSHLTRKAYIWPDTKWPENTVVYEFAAAEFDEAQRLAILAAIRDIEQHTCIQFRERRDEETNYVLITGKPDGCYANVGFSADRGIHVFNLALNEPGSGCFVHTIIIHEWLHIIGFVHMQSTYNRDDYVRVLWENVLSGTEHNFEAYSSEIVSNHGIPYEYASNMHYGPYGFSKNGEPTLLGYYDYDNEMGQLDYVTEWDWLRANRHYNCPGAWTTPV